MSENIYEVRSVSKTYRKIGEREGTCAVDQAQLSIRRGEVFGLVGESGSGKSTLGRVMGKLMLPSSGKLIFNGEDVTTVRPHQARPLRKDLQMVFQQSTGSLDPKRTIQQILEEPLKIHFKLNRTQRLDRVCDLMRQVGIDPDDRHKTVGQLSGGQRQRVGIARAISVKPALIILDEPVSALDVSVQGQIINLLMDLKRDGGYTYLLISHDLNVIRHMCDRVAVMKSGEILEVGSVSQVLQHPKTTYAKKLVEAFRLEG